jgi:hypothetical protein
LSLSPFVTDESAIAGFEKLLGRQSTPAEREQLFRVKEALGLRENDALWLILFALQYYESLYRQFPKAIGVEASRILAQARETVDAQVKAGAEQAKADLARAVAIAAQGVARDAARRRMIEWLVGGMALGAALVGAGFFAGLALGH